MKIDAWGEILKAAHGPASDAAKTIVTDAVKSAIAGGDLVKALEANAVKAAKVVEKQAVELGKKTLEKAAMEGAKALLAGKNIWSAELAVLGAAKDQALALAKDALGGAYMALESVGKLAGTAVGVVKDVVSKAAGIFGKSVNSAATKFSPTASPQNNAIERCPETLEAKIARMEKRNKVIALGNESPNPGVRQAAQRLEKNNIAVDAARLSAHAYTVYDPKKKDKPDPPPIGNEIVGEDDLAAMNINKNLLEDSKAVIYKKSAGMPNAGQIVLAFRGSAEFGEIKVNADQAMGEDTVQYKSATQLGQAVALAYGPNALVTGHSLGGGKAQAAGIASGLKGYAFNSSGPHPNTTPGMKAVDGQFEQYRAEFDPLTGIQNSPALQGLTMALFAKKLAPVGVFVKVGSAFAKKLIGVGLPEKYVELADITIKAFPKMIENMLNTGSPLPKAIGNIHQVTSIDADGKPNPAVFFLDQHLISGVINGIEAEKTADQNTITGATQ